MSRYTHTPRMFTPRLAPQPTPVIYAPSPYYESPTRGRRQSLGSHFPGQQHMYHVATSDPSHSRHHRSSSKSHKHRGSHSTDRHGGSRHHRHHRRSATPEVQYATIPSSRRRHSYSVPDRHYRSSSRGPHRALHHGHREHHYVSTRHRESIGERIKRFFGIGTHKVRLEDSRRHRVDRLGQPIYAV